MEYLFQVPLIILTIGFCIFSYKIRKIFHYNIYNILCGVSAIVNYKIKNFVASKFDIISKVDIKNGVYWLEYENQGTSYVIRFPRKRFNNNIIIIEEVLEINQEITRNITKEFFEIWGINQDFSNIDFRPSDCNWKQIKIRATNKHCQEFELIFDSDQIVKF